jgi:hypothetical protein
VKCTFCRRNPADFRTKGSDLIKFVCASCVWTAEIRAKQLNYELVDLPTREETKNDESPGEEFARKFRELEKGLPELNRRFAVELGLEPPGPEDPNRSGET